MAIIELVPQNILASPGNIGWVERTNQSVDYYDGSQKHTIMYGSVAAAEAAVDAWRDEVGVFGEPLALVDGDIVEVDRAADKGSPKSAVIFRAAPTGINPYWIFESIESPGQLIFVFEEISLIKRVV